MSQFRVDREFAGSATAALASPSIGHATVMGRYESSAQLAHSKARQGNLGRAGCLSLSRVATASDDHRLQMGDFRRQMGAARDLDAPPHPTADGRQEPDEERYM